MSLLQPNPMARVAVLHDRPGMVQPRTDCVARTWLCVTVLLLVDLVALALAATVSIVAWPHFGIPFSPELYMQLWPVLWLFPLAYAASGLYPSFGRNPAEELRRLTIASSLVYPALAVTIFLLKDSESYSRGVFVMAWAQTLLYVPLLRAMARSACSRKSWWGYPIVVVGAPLATSRIVDTLAGQPQLGLKPVAAFERPEPAIALAREREIRHVIFAMAGASPRAAREFFDRCSDLFANIIVIPDMAGFSSLWVEARDLNGTLGLGVHQRLLLPGPRFIKRSLDLLLAAVFGIVALPAVGIIALLIKLTSPGPVFYGQVRRGQGGMPFVAWKFRSMFRDSSQLLERCLDSDGGLREEWRRTRKLRHDPRITPLGRFLRRTSLDELPQLWNIARGQMSFIGPRPIVTEEISRYGEGFALYGKVTPGLSGLWQVSGRNNLSYEQRVTLDLYYVRNWSIWLDIYILARTVKVVVLGDGAY
jgi:Undecaprenyl-phosphate galactose phosphotransferase WbaP